MQVSPPQQPCALPDNPPFFPESFLGSTRSSRGSVCVLVLDTESYPAPLHTLPGTFQADPHGLGLVYWLQHSVLLSVCWGPPSLLPVDSQWEAGNPLLCVEPGYTLSRGPLEPVWGLGGPGHGGLGDRWLDAVGHGHSHAGSGHPSSLAPGAIRLEFSIPFQWKGTLVYFAFC